MENSRNPAPTREVEIQFFDFDDLQSIPAVSEDVQVEVMRAGDLRSNGRTVQNKNAVTFSRKYPIDAAFDGIIPDFLGRIGGATGVKGIVNRMKPARAFLRLHIPAKSSDVIQDDVIRHGTPGLLRAAGLDLDFWLT